MGGTIRFLKEVTSFSAWFTRFIAAYAAGSTRVNLFSSRRHSWLITTVRVNSTLLSVPTSLVVYFTPLHAISQVSS